MTKEQERILKQLFGVMLFVALTFAYFYFFVPASSPCIKELNHAKEAADERFAWGRAQDWLTITQLQYNLSVLREWDEKLMKIKC